MNPQTRPLCPLNITAQTLSAWRDDALEASVAEQISQHLDTCQACQQVEREFDRIALLLRRQHELEPGTEIWQGVRGRLQERDAAPLQLYHRRNGPGPQPGTRQDRRDRVLPLFRAGQRWSARVMTLVAALLLVVLVGGLTLGLILVHRADSGTPAVTIQEFALTTPCGATGCVPAEITSGPDGNLWFTEAGNNRIGRITPGGKITEFPLPSSTGEADPKNPRGFDSSSPRGITAGPDGNLWFTEVVSNRIGRITPGGKITEFPLPSNSGKEEDPGWITTGPDGNLWFTEMGDTWIGRITPEGTITVFPLPPDSGNPEGITSGPDGNLWFTDASNWIGRITPDGTLTEFPLPSTSRNPGAGAITAGPDGNLWFTEGGTNRIGRITPQGAFAEFPLPNFSSPGWITAGPDGNLWFTDSGNNRVGRITPGGTPAEFPLPSNSGSPEGITSGPDGNLWFADTGGNWIGRVILGR